MSVRKPSLLSRLLPSPLALSALLALSFLLAMGGCGGEEHPASETPAETTGPSEEQEVAQEDPPESEQQPETSAPVLSDTEARAVGQAVNGLGAALWTRLAAEPGNLAFSPASITAALAMTAAGARGETGAQMHRVLHLEGDPSAAIGHLGAALRAWHGGGGEGNTLRIANRLFGEQEYTFEEAFLTSTRERFASPLERVDFRNAVEPTRARINGWVEQQTQDRIQNLLPPRSIDASTRLVLVNAIYLDAAWANAFDAAQTQPRHFAVSANERPEVPTMHRRGRIRYGQSGGADIVELPYRGEALTMRFILPSEGSSPEAWLTAERLNAPTPLMPTMVELYLPRFRVAPGGSIALKQQLIELGMPLAFDSEQADFRDIADPPNPADRLHISEVLHKAFVEVDEEGTEAAAATAVVMARGGGMPAPPAVVRFDRPFLFVLYEARTGAALFVGRVSDPRG